MIQLHAFVIRSGNSRYKNIKIHFSVRICVNTAGKSDFMYNTNRRTTYMANLWRNKLTRMSFIQKVNRSFGSFLAS